jgi:hypothetical protein
MDSLNYFDIAVLLGGLALFVYLFIVRIREQFSKPRALPPPNLLQKRLSLLPAWLGTTMEPSKKEAQE